MATTIGPSDVAAFAKRHGNQYLEVQTNLASPILDTKLLEQVVLKSGVKVVNIMAGPKSSTGWVGDGSTLPDGDSSVPQQGRIVPKAMFSRISIGRIAATIGMGLDEAADMTNEQLNSAAEECSQKVARSIFDNKLAKAEGGLQQWTGTAVGSLVTITVKDISGYRADGQVIQMGSGSAGLKVSVQSLSPETVGDAVYGGGRVVLRAEEALTSTNFTGSSVDFYVNGAITTANADSTNALSSFVVANTSGSALHSLAWNTAGWVGNEFSSFGTLDDTKVGVRMSQVAQLGGLEPSALFVNPIVYSGLAAAGLSAGATFMGITSPGSAARRDVGANLDKYAGIGYPSAPGERVHPTLTLRGKPVLQDPNCPISKIVLHQTADTKLYRYDNGDFKPAPSADTLGRSKFDYDIQMQGFVELGFSKRRRQGLISGLTQV